MLSERQLEALLQIFDARMQEVTDDYISRMGEHLRDIGRLTATDVHRLTELKRLNANVDAVRAQLARAAKRSQQDIDQVFLAVAESDYRFASKYYGEARQMPIRRNKAILRILQAQARITAQEMRNLSRTTLMSEGYRKAVDTAIQTVQSGLTDYSSAIRSAVRRAGQEGLRVRYPNSGLTRRLDTAVRQNVLDGVRSINRDVLWQTGKEFGANGVELSAHSLCAPDHLPWQGRQYSMREFENLQMQLDRQFGQWNCKHTIYPIKLGISAPTCDDAELERMRQQSTMRIEIDGEEKTRYEWTQEQRRLETAIRQQKDVANLAKVSGDNVLRRETQRRINDLTAQYERISDRAGLIEQRERMSVAGFRRVNTQIADTGASTRTPIDWAAANNFAGGDVRLTNMLRSGDAQQMATAVNEILDHDEYGFRASKWSGKVHVRDTETMKGVLGAKEWTCDISIRRDNVGNLKTYIHENLHSRSASYFSVDTFRRNRPTEEASVEYMAQQICKRSGIPFSLSYSTFVNALEDVRKVTSRRVGPYDFAKIVFDMDEDKRYTYIVNLVNGYRIDNPKMRKTLQDRLTEDLRVLAGIEKGGRTYG